MAVLVVKIGFFWFLRPKDLYRGPIWTLPLGIIVYRKLGEFSFQTHLAYHPPPAVHTFGVEKCAVLLVETRFIFYL